MPWQEAMGAIEEGTRRQVREQGIGRNRFSFHTVAVSLKRPTWEWKGCLVARKNIVSGSWPLIFIKSEGRREPRRGAIFGSSASGDG
jgi:hypothetical protein